MEQYKGKENERGKEANSPETKHLPEIHVHVGNFLPWSAVVKNSTLIKWTEKTGADKLEWMAVGPVSEKVPVGPTHEVLAKPVSALQEIFGKTLGHGHVIFNPYASLWGILGRKPDPLRPGESLALYNLILSNEAVSRNALQKLEMVKENKFPVVVYPPFRGTEIQSKYKESYLQTHPAFYDDARNTENLIKAVRDRLEKQKKNFFKRLKNYIEPACWVRYMYSRGACYTLIQQSKHRRNSRRFLEKIQATTRNWDGHFNFLFTI